MGVMGMGAAPMPPEMAGGPVAGLPPELAAAMAADPTAPEVGAIAPSPVDQAMMGGMGLPPAGPDPIVASTDPNLLSQAIASAIEQARGAGHAHLDMPQDEAAMAAQQIVGGLMAPPPDPSRAMIGGAGAPMPALPTDAGPVF